MEYEKIQDLKKDKKINNEFNFIKPMAIKLYSRKIKLLLKCIILAIFFEPKIVYINNGQELLISYPFEKNKRLDYEEIINELKKIVVNYNELFFQYDFTLKNFFKSIKEIIKNFIILKDIKDITKIEKLKIASLKRVVFLLKTKLENIKFEEKILITFCDAYFEENIITQIFNNTNKKTLTLQHGQYRFLKEKKYNETAEAYKNFISDFICIWGEKTRNEFLKAGIDKCRLLELGSLKKFQKKIKKIRDESVFCIILDGETYEESNYEMIKIANKISQTLNKKYYIRFHPMNNKIKYEKEVDKRNYLQEYIENKNPDFSILHMTSVMIEMLANNERFYIYNDKYQEEIFQIEELIFSTEEEFMKKYSGENSQNFNKIYKLFNIEDDYEKIKLNYLSTIEKIKKGELKSNGKNK